MTSTPHPLPEAVTATLDALFEVFASLSDLGASLTEADWKRPTDLPAWNVQDNLSHLIAIERRLEGLPGTEHRAQDLSMVQNPIGEANEHEVDARRTMTGAEVLAEWNAIAAQRVATLSTAPPEYFATETMTPTGPGTLGDFLSIRVLDCWSHEQDMRRAVGVSGNLDGLSAAHTLDRLIRTLPIVVGKRAATPEGATVVVTIDGEVKRTVPITVTEGRARIVESVPADVLATVSMDTECFAVLALGRRPWNDASLARHWKITGDVDLGGRILAGLNMMI